MQTPLQLDLFAEPTASSREDSAVEEVLAPAQDYDFTALFDRLSRSTFRSRFHLKPADRQYILERGMSVICQHATDMIARRLAPADIPNDSRQTPMHGHPVFIAQHATGCCCRGCMSKWHHIPPGRPLTAEEQHYIVEVITAWLQREMNKN